MKYCKIIKWFPGAPTAGLLLPFSAGQGRQNIKKRLIDLAKERERSLRILTAMGKTDLTCRN